MAEKGRIASDRTDFVIIPEPFGAGRICVGHRGVYWFKVTSHGRAAHGSMPFLGVNAIEHMGIILEAVRSELMPVELLEELMDECDQLCRIIGSSIQTARREI